MTTDIFVPLYRYGCQVDRVIDGDTLDVLIDQGLHCFRRERVRLLNVDCPEQNTVSGRAAREFTCQWVGAGIAHEVIHRAFNGWPFVIQTFKADSFGRWLGILARRFDNAVLNQDLIDNKHYKVKGQ